MAYHALLDWRLALDMVRLALDPNAPIDLVGSDWQVLLSQVARPYFSGLGLTPTTHAGLQVGLNQVNNEAVILVHPLWDLDRANYHPSLAAAVAEVERAGLSPAPCSLFRATRFPYE